MQGVDHFTDHARAAEVVVAGQRHGIGQVEAGAVIQALRVVFQQVEPSGGLQLRQQALHPSGLEVLALVDDDQVVGGLPFLGRFAVDARQQVEVVGGGEVGLAVVAPVVGHAQLGIAGHVRHGRGQPADVVGQRAVEAHVQCTAALGDGIVEQAQRQLGLARAGRGLDTDQAVGGLDARYPGGQPLGQALGGALQLLV